MSAIGPALPPHLLAKRKRQAEQEETAAAETERPSTPPEKKKRVMGPAPPPAPLEERPTEKEDSDADSDSDDDWGPAPPPVGGDASATKPGSSLSTRDLSDATSTPKQEEPKIKRDDWMMVPPSQDNLAARMDPTKLRAKGFNTGKGARAAQANTGEISAIWTETPEQKRKRLENEVLGISKPEAGVSVVKNKRDEETARRIREHNEKSRGKSLVEQHQGRQDKEEDDDPSKRVFDYEKDMGAGSRIGQVQKKEMLKRAGDFGSRFSSGSYL